MKVRSLVNFGVSLVMLSAVSLPALAQVPTINQSGAGESNPQRGYAAYTSPAALFRSLIPSIQGQLPQGLVMRLPGVVPTQLNNGLRYRPEIQTSPESGYFAVKLTDLDCPEPVMGVCDGGTFFVAHHHFDSSELLQEGQQNGTKLNLGGGITGFYRSHSHPNKGLIRRMVWEQDGLVYGVASRSMSQQQLLNVAASMANSVPIYDVTPGFEFSSINTGF
jgi:hypothetical protein